MELCQLSLANPAASRGIRGLLGCAAPRMNEQEVATQPPNVVLVHVYDLGGTDFLKKMNKLSTVNNSILIGGFFHVGVEVYGEEWGFGATDADESGIFDCVPRAHPEHSFRATVRIGATPFSITEVWAVLEDMKTCWRGREYDLLHRNCLDFANAFCTRLGVGRIPRWIDRFSRFASTLGLASKKLSSPLSRGFRKFHLMSCPIRKPSRSGGLLESSGSDDSLDSVIDDSPRSQWLEGERAAKRRRVIYSAASTALRCASSYRPRISRHIDVEGVTAASR